MQENPIGAHHSLPRSHDHCHWWPHLVHCTRYQVPGTWYRALQCSSHKWVKVRSSFVLHCFVEKVKKYPSQHSHCQTRIWLWILWSRWLWEQRLTESLGKDSRWEIKKKKIRLKNWQKVNITQIQMLELLMVKIYNCPELRKEKRKTVFVKSGKVFRERKRDICWVVVACIFHRWCR